ncbi:MAG: hypothetical protein KZQ66_01575 [Candidatus Thiodiazotropha sp. (ex Lucinoma aequizonata)]|nr:hypothetical protein [Candidatus Thiodiazotropha sp. (ex Lucinoma aequizonata)]MCU7900247.1 hypothetical protein [Candidatus Thiodiazotropha sp. (ex Lucinoma aequizonata)]MCU7900862.1 hypothetical protein [Candidatus Thiodiazotropha sp. (ex Lucinoma aequizonata)]
MDWEAVNHYNTDNPHSHVVVHGIDTEGQDVFIDREYISNGIRNRAREIVTTELGERLEHEIQASISEEINAPRFTSQDREIEGLANAKGTVDVGTYPNSTAERLSCSKRIGRLQRLKGYGFAEGVGELSWKIDKNLRLELQKLGRYKSAMDIMSRSLQEHHIDLSRYQVFDQESSDNIGN